MNTTPINNRSDNNRIEIVRRWVAGALLVAGLGAAALGSAAASHADTSPLPHNNDSAYTHPAFPGYRPGHGMPGYSPSPHIGHRHAHRD